MDLELSDEQRLLQDSIARFLSGRYDAGQRRRSAGEAGGLDRSIWREMAELGWLALAVPEDDGGLGGSGIELSLLAEGLGRALVVEPVLDTLVATRLLSQLGTAAQREAWLPPVMEGHRLVAFAHQEGSRVLSAGIATVAEPVGSGWRLTGRKDFVFAGPGADAFLVTARTGPELGVFLVESGRDGAAVHPFDTVDGRRACRLVLDEAPGERLGSGDAGPAVDEALDVAALALSAEAVGCMDALLAATVEYTKTREQFGRPLAANQVLRHRMADMSVACAEARGIALRAALALHEPSPARARAASAAKSKTGRAGRTVAEGAIQLHGGMGVTDELDIGLYAKRLLAIGLSYGTDAQHLRRHAALRGHAQ